MDFVGFGRRLNAPRREGAPFSNKLLSAVAAALHPPTQHVLHQPEDIRTILHRECARCERSGSKFCLVVVDPGGSPLAQKQLGDILLGDARGTDEIGLLDELHLCAFLPYTLPEGADTFITRFKERALALGWKPAVELFVYPSDQSNNECFGDSGTDRRNVQQSHENSESPVDKKAAVGRVEALLARESPAWKRATDITVSSSALLIVWPLMLGIALLLKLTSRGPIFFSQWRIGIGGKPFRMHKFRTMVPNADVLKSQLLHKNEQDGPAFKMARDPRITRIGRVLRVTSMDELPQLWNVLKGDMSLVGPRPLELKETEACHPWQKRRADVVPGLTCTWQISGRGSVSFAEWARMDRNYIHRRSFFHDFKLLAKTVPAVLGRRGAM